jgi:hydrogen peroxide-dependent heme synthase
VPEHESNDDLVSASEGWMVLHLFCSVNGPVDTDAILDAVKTVEGAGDQVVTMAVLGHKADLGFMALSPHMWQLRELQTRLQRAGLEVVGSYVSLTELSEYAKGLPDEMKEARLHPRLPPADKRAFCFYPMSKRRNEGHNWYSLEFDERLALMHGHGKVGRTFAGRVVQLITGSTGLDDWEWGVSLFAKHPDDLKKCVYEMRFDEASALYADFGPFWTGIVGDAADVLSRVAER